MPLILYSDIQARKDLSASVKEVRVNQHINDAELSDLKPLMGERLFYDVSRKRNDATYNVLLNGGNYVYNDFTYECPGLKVVLIEFTYARLQFLGNEVSTPFGFVEKNYKDGVHPSRDRSKERYKATRQMAFQLWKDVEAYLDRNASDFEYWGACNKTRLPNGGIKLTHIR